MRRLIFLMFTLGGLVYPAARIRVLESTSRTLVIQVHNPLTDADDLKPIPVLIGCPDDTYPSLEVEANSPQSVDIRAGDSLVTGIRWIQKQRFQGLHTATLEISPLESENRAYGLMRIRITFPPATGPYLPPYPRRSSLRNRILNWEVARTWRISSPSRSLSKSQSFPAGQWIKLAIDADGPMYVTGQNVLDLATGAITGDPRSFSLYAGSHLGRAFSQTPNQPVPENLVEIAVKFQGEDNGVLDPTDTLFFYAQGPSGFDVVGQDLVYNQNVYSTTSVYWLLIPENTALRGARLDTYPPGSYSGTAQSAIHTALHSERDQLNPYESGLLWVQNAIAPGASQALSFVCRSPVTSGSNAQLKVRFYGGTTTESSSFASHRITVTVNGQELEHQDLTWAGFGEMEPTLTLAPTLLVDGVNSLVLSNRSGDPASAPYYDRFTLYYDRHLTVDSGPVQWYDMNFPTAFQGTGPIPDEIWDVTQAENPVQLSPVGTDGNWQVTVTGATQTVRRFLAFNHPQAVSPVSLEWVGARSFTQLRNPTLYAEYVIIGPEEFRSAATPLLERRSASLYASLETIYDEFTGGCADPMAIRFFIQWMREHGSALPPLRPLVFLLGDADYDYRNLTGKSHNIVPTVEKGLTSTWATDDRLATVYGSIPEVPIGRYPAHTVEDVTAYVEKILELEDHPQPGLWRQTLTLVADDTKRPEHLISQISTGKSHTLNSEILAGLVDPAVTVKKLYMIEYPEVSDASSYGVVKPDATEALFRQVREGTAIINYIGHGSEHQWAQERLLFQDRGDVARIQTGMKLPLWIAGTCSWGHFDYVDNEAFSEELIRRPRDGAAAIITTSRLITVSSNQYYTEQIFRSLFPHHRVTRQPLGDILQSVKTGNADGELFHLFGDPALHIALAADTLDRIEVDRDTLQALAVATYTGSQSVLNGPGYGFVTLRDADRPVTRHYSFLNTEQSLSFVLPGPTLFRGQISFTGNQLQGQVRLPNDLSYSAAPGYLSLYIYSTETGFQEALGSRGNIYFQGGLPTQDHSGPIIQFETDSGRRLGPGDHLNPDDRLWVRLTDPLGINLTGEIGHTIEWTRVDRGETIDITDRFVYDLNSITTGTIEILSDEYSSGETVRVQAWDSANNPADAEITLYRITQSALRLLNVLNFPNPFHSATDFTFEISAAADVTVDIYTLNGRRLVRLGPRPFPPGFATLHWDGRDQWGNRLANGVYLYRIQAKNQSESVSRIERCAKYE